MGKYIVLLLALMLQSCSKGPTESYPFANSAFSIKTDSSSYTVANKFTATITFTNRLGSNVYIINAGCGFPNFLMERLEDSKWVAVGGPMCVAVAVPPTLVLTNSSFTSTVSMYTDSLTTGSYRLRFDIREEDLNHKLDSTLIFTNSFLINE
jgi:hypothetical protein